MSHPAFDWKTVAITALTATVAVFMIAAAAGYLRF